MCSSDLKDTNDEPVASPRRIQITAGQAHSSAWTLSGANESITTNRSSATQTSILTSIMESHLDEALNLGIYQAARGTLRVDDHGHFSGPLSERLQQIASASGGSQAQAPSTIQGAFTLSAAGRVEAASWTLSSRPGLTFHAKYIYANTLAGADLPADSRCSVDINGTNHVLFDVRILQLVKAKSDIDDATFLPESFKVNSAERGPSIIESNGQAFLVDSKGVVQRITLPDVSAHRARSAVIARIVIVTIFFVFAGVLVAAYLRIRKSHIKHPNPVK